MAKVKKEYFAYVCDVCGEDAEGEWFSVEHLNGEVIAEYTCPINLCKEHMEIFARRFNEYKVERYDNSSNEDKAKELIQKIKNLITEKR